MVSRPPVSPFVTRYPPLLAAVRRLTGVLTGSGPGRAVLVVGPEGAGKTTMVRHVLERRERERTAEPDAARWLQLEADRCPTPRRLTAFLAAQRALDLIIDDVDAW